MDEEVVEVVEATVPEEVVEVREVSNEEWLDACESLLDGLLDG